METEIEAKFLDININKIKKKLNSLKAKLIHKERLMKRVVFDYPDNKLEKIGGWIRVRDEGDKITLSYKQLNDRTLYGTKEINLVIDNLENACLFLESIGFDKKAYQETKREEWLLDNVEISIDTWPWIPSFVELEGKDEKSVKNITKKLDLDWSKAMHGSVETAYQKYYDVTEEEIDHWESITFIPTPKWLERKRKIINKT